MVDHNWCCDTANINCGLEAATVAGYSRFAADFDSEFDPGLPIFCVKTARKQPENSQKQIRGQPADNEKAKNSQKQHFFEKRLQNSRGKFNDLYIYK